MVSYRLLVVDDEPLALSLIERVFAAEVHVEISDTGGGIDPAVRARLFEPFVTTKEIGKGTGLGLSICKNIIESHGGSISVDSEQGKGARFTFALPAAA